MSSMDGMMKLQFNLKFTAKQFAKDSKKCEKEEKQAKQKAAKAIAKGLDENARIYAQDAIRKKNEQTNFLRLSSRLEAVAGKVATAIKMRNVTKTMGGVVKGMDKALQSMRYDEISRVMDAFEQQFEDLDVAMEYTEGAIGQTTALTTPASQVDDLLSQIADENNLEYKSNMAGIGVGKEKLAEAEADDLSARLAKLKEGK